MCKLEMIGNQNPKLMAHYNRYLQALDQELLVLLKND